MRRVLMLVALVALISPVHMHSAHGEGHLDPAHDAALPCEALSTPGLPPRAAKDIAHVANVCGFVGTDIEFQTRALADGSVRDYAFVGTMGAGTRIFDITDPTAPVLVGGYMDPGWENDLQVRGDVLVLGFDPIGPVTPKTSACLTAKSATDGGIDIVRLRFDAANGTFRTELIDCVPNAGGSSSTSRNGAHNATLHPSGTYLVMISPRANGSVDVVDLRGPTAVHRWRLVQDGSLANNTCKAGIPCRSIGRGGTWSPHDVSFSRDGNTMYVAAVGNDAVIVDVTNVLETGNAKLVGVAPNDHDGVPGIGPSDVSIAHQSDTTADGKILIVTDERGGGLDETSCNTTVDPIIGAAHFWALAPIDGIAATANASPRAPVHLGDWIYPNPLLLPDPLAPALAAIGRTERGCTIHVFRAGGNGTAGPGEIAKGSGGVSSLPIRQLTTAHYGAGVWHLDVTGRSRSDDAVAEDARSTWANTLGWNVMPGADTWSAKEYKGWIFASDMGRGFDVYALASCQGAGCLTTTANLPGRAQGGGKLEDELDELVVLRGTNPGGKVQFGFDVGYSAAALAPAGSLTFQDKGAGKKVVATSIDAFQRIGQKATMRGRATVNGVPGVAFVVEVEDLGGAGADTFRIVLADGYGAFGAVTKGNVTVGD